MRLATLEIDGWTLDDGEATHRAHPTTFGIPPRAVRESLAPGRHAKLRFRIRVVDSAGRTEDCGEKMWVQVHARIAGRYRGALANQPSCTDDIAPGMTVWFEPRHVIDVEPDE